MKILFLNRLNKWFREEVEMLRQKHSNVTFYTEYAETDDERKKHAWLREADAVIAGRISEEQLEIAENLKVIFVPFVGIDPFPLDKIREKGIILSNAHGNAIVTAEKALALATALLGRIVYFHNALAKGYWHRSHKEEDRWESMYGKRFGIMGTGHVGSALARFLKPFDGTITGYKRRSGKVPEHFDKLAKSPDALIHNSDIIFLTLPLTAATKHIVDSNMLKQMKGKYLINTGRGELIDETGMYNALKNGTLAGAGLDVWYNYPGKDKQEPVFPSDYPFHELPQVVMSPHKASHVVEGIRGNIRKTAENIEAFISSGKPATIVDTGAGY